MTKLIRNLIYGGVILVFTCILIPWLFESNTAGQILVITSPSGHIQVYSSPGVHWQGFGSVMHYNKRGAFVFSKHDNQGAEDADAIEIRFNDSGTAKISGVLNYELPGDDARVIDLHSQYLSPEAVEQNLIRTALQKSIFATGALMTSTESFSSKRNELFVWIRDQLMSGIYLTNGDLVKETDKLGLERTITKVAIKMDTKTGLPVLAEKSIFERFGVQVQSFSLSDVDYDDRISAQIQASLDSTMKVQTAIADAKKAEQDKVTAEQKGLADKAVATAIANVEMAKATIEADKEKAVAITKAQQQKEVAQLALDAAKLEAQATVEKGKGDAEARKLVMEADGALEKKLTAWTTAQQNWATAFSQIKVPVVPGVVMSANGSQGGQANSLETLMQLMGVKMAQDLNLDLSPKK